MPKPYSDKKLGLGEPLASKLRDFSIANYRAPALEIIREALNEHIDRRLLDPEMKRRFDEVRADRLGRKAEPLKLVRKEPA